MTIKPDIITSNGHIRLIDTKDANALADYYARNRTHFLPWEPVRGADFYEVETMFNRILEAEGAFYADQQVKLGVFNLQHRRMIASIDFSQIVRGPLQSCFVGFSIDAQHQGQGLMQEFMPWCLEYMFNHFNIHRIMATYMVKNDRSQALLERLGFEKEGYAKSYLNIAGTWEDHILTALVNPSH
ncbi:MAG: GNAT family N-acetyltransferase [Gammaproteobacteria bacterium]|jgi:ribosomal-protein-alanine N-acetyltransferase|tara:strand:- start:382 stop:936 length:555 start_codon:yes stop_codon:yes gene_type:complete